MCISCLKQLVAAISRKIVSSVDCSGATYFKMRNIVKCPFENKNIVTMHVVLSDVWRSNENVVRNGSN